MGVGVPGRSGVLTMLLHSWYSGYPYLNQPPSVEARARKNLYCSETYLEYNKHGLACEPREQHVHWSRSCYRCPKEAGNASLFDDHTRDAPSNKDAFPIQWERDANAGYRAVCATAVYQCQQSLPPPCSFLSTPIKSSSLQEIAQSPKRTVPT